MPTSHKAQVQGQLWISGRKWTDFVSFDPRINAESSYFCVRIERDEDYIKDIEAACFIFTDELRAIINDLGANNEKSD